MLPIFLTHTCIVSGIAYCTTQIVRSRDDPAHPVSRVEKNACERHRHLESERVCREQSSALLGVVGRYGAFRDSHHLMHGTGLT